MYLDMTDLTSTCPSGWNITGYSRRTCGRASNTTNTCDSATFPVSGGDYSKVCGRIKGYQCGSTDAFGPYHVGLVTTIDDAYTNGVSLTHGSPRQHIWTFAAGLAENPVDIINRCPCDTSFNINIPPFVGEDYFCESGNNGAEVSYKIFYPDDPLWDGQNCLPSSSCCSLHGPPYFIKQLPTPTTDDIEARICLNEVSSNEDVAIELVELYVQ